MPAQRLGGIRVSGQLSAGMPLSHNKGSLKNILSTCQAANKATTVVSDALAAGTGSLVLADQLLSGAAAAASGVQQQPTAWTWVAVCMTGRVSWSERSCLVRAPCQGAVAAGQAAGCQLLPGLHTVSMHDAAWLLAQAHGHLRGS